MEHQQLKQELEQLGFKIYSNDLLDPSNLSRWYACRRSSEPMRNCECNDKPPQLIIQPHYYVFNKFSHRTCEVYMVGELDGVWYDIKAYSLLPEEMLEKLNLIEDRLINAWGGLDI